MAHPKGELKRTDHINFGKALDGIPKDIAPLVHDCTRKRKGIEEALKHLDGSSETVISGVREYVAMRMTINSLVKKVKSSSRLSPSQDSGTVYHVENWKGGTVISKILSGLKKEPFKWTNILEEEKTVSQSVDVDTASMLVGAGLWHMQHAHLISSSIKESEENEDKMKEMLHSLKTAAGIFDCVKAWPNLGEGERDLQANTARTLGLQSLAEAQSVTIRRAISKGHKPSLISELCCDVSLKYKTAADELDTSNHQSAKWASYLRYQAELYLALSRCFQGVHLLDNEDKCGESIVVLNESLKHIEVASKLAREYDKEKPKSKVHLDESPEFIKVKKLINEKKAKSDRENGMIYHQRLPEDCPALYEPKCLVQATPFELPQDEDLTERPTSACDESDAQGEPGKDDRASENENEENEGPSTS